VSASLLFSDIRTEIDFDVQEGTIFDVEPAARITSVSYLGEERWILTTTVLTLRDWVGYGKYEGPFWAGP
jgi:hypothetical protein